MPIKFLVLGGGGKFRGFLEGGVWKCQFYFYGRGIFLKFIANYGADSQFIARGS